MQSARVGGGKGTSPTELDNTRTSRFGEKNVEIQTSCMRHPDGISGAGSYKRIQKGVWVGDKDLDKGTVSSHWRV